MPAVTMPDLRHEDFCPVVAKEQEPRMESFPYLADDPASGRAVPTHKVTRCLDCGAASYKQIGA